MAGTGNDLVRGNEGNDRVYGGFGDDGYVMGDEGRDTLWGGSGADRFRFDDGDSGTYALRDRIADFSEAEGDRIDLHWIDARSSQSGDQGFVWIATLDFFAES